jgi:hypothetical protein
VEESPATNQETEKMAGNSPTENAGISPNAESADSAEDKMAVVNGGSENVPSAETADSPVYELPTEKIIEA